MDKEIKQLKERVDELEKIVKSFNNSTTIPLNVDSAFRKRFNIAELSKKELSKSSKDATSENKTVNEAGSSTYSVLKSPDEFLQVDIDGVIYYLPCFT